MVQPRSLTSALRSAGLEPVRVLDAQDGPTTAVSGEGVRFTVTVVPAEAVGARDLRVRVAALASLHHEHLARTGPVLDLGDGRWALLRQGVHGTGLRDLCDRRGPWEPGEVVTLLVPLAQALAVLHRAGLSHGRVGPGAVVLTPDGRPVLVATCPGPGDEVPVVTPLGDLAELGRLGLELLTPAVGPSQPDPGTELTELRAVLIRAAGGELAAEGLPATGERFAAALLETAAPDPIEIPEPVAPPRSLTQAAQSPAAPGASRPRSRHRAASRAGARDVAAAPSGGLRATLLGGGDAPRRRRVGMRGPATVAVLGCAAALVWAVAGGTGPATSSALSEQDPATAALELTAVRAQALAAGDLDLLASVTVPGSPAAVADLATARQAGALGPAEVDLDLLSARVLTEGADDVRVLVTSRVAAAATAGAEHGDGPDGVTDAEGGPEVVDDGREVGARSVVLVLRPTGAGWAVQEVEEYRP